jgi:hypothetical protein
MNIFVVGANQSGSQLRIKGEKGDKLWPSDALTIFDVFAVNPQTLEPTQLLRVSAITRSYELTGEVDVIEIAPALIDHGQFKNVSNLPANGAECFINRYA